MKNQFQTKEKELLKASADKRKEAGITQPDLAKKTGLTQQMISRYEKGKSPSLENFLKYIDGMGLKIELKNKNETM